MKPVLKLRQASYCQSIGTSKSIAVVTEKTSKKFSVYYTVTYLGIILIYSSTYTSAS